MKNLSPPEVMDILWAERNYLDETIEKTAGKTRYGEKLEEELEMLMSYIKKYDSEHSSQLLDHQINKLLAKRE